MAASKDSDPYTEKHSQGDWWKYPSWQLVPRGVIVNSSTLFAVLFFRHSEKLFPLLSAAPHFKKCLTAGPGPHNEMHCLTPQVPSCVRFCSPQAKDWRVTQIYNCHVPCAWVITQQMQYPSFSATKWFGLDFHSLSHRVLRAETVIVWLPGSADSQRY